ncbi:hypothetical protein GFM09_33785 [Rhizobium leguminosarum bv. viciae]|uniref:hypothetical protein n=1 Tax=Rhizobium leguminosarum TaxID=384 RepID=UPI001441B939|nr:hypothetical protein [Rhizobium leguminosarum]NKL74119.1 hypothetical protein [Rhizobium leguminosarum bv. viciae]
MMTVGVAKYNEYLHQKELSGEDVLNIIFEPKAEWKPANGFGVEEYINAIHPKIPGKKRQGQVALLHRVGDGEDGKGEWSTTYCRTEDAAEKAKAYLSTGAGRDLYVSMATFRRRRVTSEVCTIESTYLDLDYHKTSLWHRSAESVANNVIRDLEDAGKPLPSFILSSGRGLLCVWLHEMLGAKVLSKWAAVQKRLGKPLARYNPDKSAADAVRIFRLVGSINSKADDSRNRVQLVWGDPANLHRYKFNDLADAWLPHTKAQLISMADERAKRNAGKRKKRKRPDGLAMGLWSTRMEDIQNLIKHRSPDGRIEKGMQDKFLFIYTCALSHTTKPEAIIPVIRAKATEWSGGTWTESSIDGAMGTAYRKAVAALAGETVEWNGDQVDIRYRFRSSTIIDWLDISEDEMSDAGLRDLCSAEIKAERSKVRSKAWRIEKKGQTASREEQRRERLLIGRQATVLREQGKSFTDICAELGRSRAYISDAIQEAKVSINDGTYSIGATHYTPFETRTLDSQGVQETASSSDSVSNPPSSVSSNKEERKEGIPLQGATHYTPFETRTLDSQDISGTNSDDAFPGDVIPGDVIVGPWKRSDILKIEDTFDAMDRKWG